MSSFVGVLLSVARLFETVGARYAYVGSVASSNHGSPRATNDIDLITDLPPEASARFVEALGEDFYFSEASIRRALEMHKSFNLIQQELILKIDVFSVSPGSFGRNCLARRTPEPAVRGSDDKVFMITAEDTLLAKLEWFKKGGGASDRQWSDILGIIKVQGDALDMPYVREWAGKLDVLSLLNKALEEAHA